MFETKRFKVKTYVKERSNGIVEGEWLIAADIGYSGAKVMSPSMCVCFPSFASRLVEDHGVMGEMDENYILYTDLNTGEKWLVGQYAQDNISDRDTSVTEEALFGRERYDDPMFRVVIRTALGFGLMRGKSNGPKGRHVSVQTGFPPAYKLDGDELVSAFTGKHDFSLQVGNKPPEEFHITLDSQQVFLMAQPMGTLFSVSVDNRAYPVAEMKGLFKKNVIVFDAGFGTLDLFPIKSGRLDKSQTNQTLGMKRIMQETCKQLQGVGINISVPALQKYLESGYARYHTRTASKNVPFSDILRSASEKVCDEAVSWLTQMFPLYEYDYLIITGGTSAAWSQMIKNSLKNMETLKIVDGSRNDTLPPVFANVRGYYLYRLSKQRAGQRG